MAANYSPNRNLTLETYLGDKMRRDEPMLAFLDSQTLLGSQRMKAGLLPLSRPTCVLLRECMNV